MPDDADQGVRHLVLVHGRAKARTMVEPAQKKLVDIAAEVYPTRTARSAFPIPGSA
jgi:hypothetical protein